MLSVKYIRSSLFIYLSTSKKDPNDDHREEITDFVQWIPGFQECDGEDVETWTACDEEECGFQMLNDDEIMTSVQESDPVDDEMDEDGDNNNSESSKGPSNADAFSALDTSMEWYEHQCGPTDVQENQRPCSEKSIYNGIVENK
ncbi:uncharacterized protein TNCV_1538371 [Trichonephila clavipes]|nr:uncharacterized protein TNCV_1538371 [Trichonephila clavipes]